MIGKYVEKLNTGGELVVSISEWSIKYYFPGPDLRYNGTFKTILGTEIEQYKEALKSNYIKYVILKKEKQEEYLTDGECGMKIWVNYYTEGVCLDSYHMAINSPSKLNAVLSDYHYAAKRAKQIMGMLEQLDDDNA